MAYCLQPTYQFAPFMKSRERQNKTFFLETVQILFLEYFMLYSCLPAGRFLSDEGILRFIAIATDRKIADVWREKTYKRTKG
ncbi:hypothetical protein DHC50_01290 [Arenibacter sp. A80]|nr:hypothetical protein [Arenibacter sp. A80]RFT57828.1 hypothetical protein D0S24_01290 [Arenibacter sp. P308M17]